MNKLIELTAHESWVVNQGDRLIVAGEADKRSGKIVGLAYQNLSKGVMAL